MNSTKKNSEFGGVKKKLTAAIAMLLVATIMMVSSTYAWFTLSTAPEVTGITTSVGANGNLEMALLPTSGETDAINTAVGDSNKAAIEKNVTWGNLVDVSDNTTYGLNNVKLNPARLNVTGSGTDGYKVAASQLLTPTYGNDGRVDTLAANTYSAVYSNAAFKAADEQTYGVRAIGTTSGMNARQIGYRNAKASAATYTSAARNEGAKTISANGDALARILVNHYMGDSTNATYTATDVDAVRNMATGLKTALGNVDNALRQYLIAEVAANLTGEGADAQFAVAKAAIENTGTKLSDLLTTYNNAPTGLTEAVTNVEKDIATVDGIISDIGASKGDGIKTSWTWDELNAWLSKIANTSSVTINGLKLEGEGAASKDTLINQVIADKFIVKVNMGDGSGLFSNVAKYAGTYQANITVNDIDVPKLGKVSASAQVTAETTGTALLNAITLSDAPTNTGAGANTTITDTYGYIIDLAVRTNAASANLKLSDAKQRIYDDSDNADTMGKGSTMSFKTSENFGDEQVKALMANIRVVFLDGTGKVLGVAALDMTSATLDAENGWTAPLHLYQYTIAAAEPGVASGKLVLTTQTTGEDENKVTSLVPVEGDVLCELAQNQATKISALVYLDGDSVQNKDVANAELSMSGKMNLQFTTDAELKPMEYTPLKGTANH